MFSFFLRFIVAWRRGEDVTIRRHLLPSLATADVLPCPRAARFLNYKPDSMRTRSIAAIRGTRSALADLLIASRRWIWLIGCSRLDGNPDFCSPTVPLLNAANHRRLIVQAENFKFTPY